MSAWWSTTLPAPTPLATRCSTPTCSDWSTALWEAGAEAVAVNGERLTNLSTIRLAGGAITVNARSLRRPYVVTAIGNPNTLPARFAETSSGQAWLDLQREVGLQLKITPAASLTLPGAEVSLRFANQEPGGAP